MKYFLITALVIVLSSCANTDPQEIINQTLEASGSNGLDNTKIEFDFRNREYGLKRNGGKYEMVRLFKDSTKLIRDVVTNDGFHREINGKQIEVADSMAFKYTNSINSVIYFALLPHGLNDDAVIKNYLGSEEIKGELYHKIKVTFQKENGGKDYEDVFIYWINKQNKFIDYFAYSYQTDGGGYRFREAINERIINGLRVVDYINYQPAAQISLEESAKAFTNGQLKELSRIELDNFLVEFNSPVL